MTVVADMEAVMVMAGHRGLLVLVIMRMAVMIVRMADARDRRDLYQPGRIGGGRAEPEHRQHEQAGQQCPSGHDSVRHHPERYKRTDKAR